MEKLSALPERDGVVVDEGITFSDQEGAVSSSTLHTEIMDQPLGHVSAFFNTAVKPGLWDVQVLVLKTKINTQFGLSFYTFTYAENL